MKNYVTQNGYQKMVSDLNQLLTIENKKAIEMIEDAREQGNISENVEYEVAKEYHSNISNKIGQLQEKIKNSEIISQNSFDKGIVNMLSTVTLKNYKSRKQQTFTLVPENEIDIKNGKISFNSPIGSSLIGKKEGDVLDIDIPSGKIKFEILKIK